IWQGDAVRGRGQEPRRSAAHRQTGNEQVVPRRPNYERAPYCRNVVTALQSALTQAQARKIAMSDIKCEVCGADTTKGADLYRVNRKGVTGIWRCIVHMTNLPDPELREIVEIIS